MSKKKGITPTVKRIINASAEIVGEGEPEELSFLHAVMAQCSLPYREPETRDYIRTNGHSSLVLSAGYLFDPKRKEPVLQGLPYGAKPRLLLIHLCTQAVRTKSPIISISDSMSSFMRELGLAVTGGQQGSIGRFKEQFNRLAAARMQLIINSEEGAAVLNPSPIIRRFDVWFPADHRQKVLWPSQVTLSDEFFENLRNYALPLDPRGIRALQHSARAIDIYTWLAHRLPRVRDRKGSRVSWQALQVQFGPDMSSVKNFKAHMLTALKQVTAVYPTARVEQVDGGLLLRRSAPPIAKRTPARLSTKSC